MFDVQHQFPNSTSPVPPFRESMIITETCHHMGEKLQRSEHFDHLTSAANCSTQKARVRQIIEVASFLDPALKFIQKKKKSALESVPSLPSLPPSRPPLSHLPFPAPSLLLPRLTDGDRSPPFFSLHAGGYDQWRDLRRHAARDIVQRLCCPPLRLLSCLWLLRRAYVAPTWCLRLPG